MGSFVVKGQWLIPFMSPAARPRRRKKTRRCYASSVFRSNWFRHPTIQPIIHLRVIKENWSFVGILWEIVSQHTSREAAVAELTIRWRNYAYLDPETSNCTSTVTNYNTWCGYSFFNPCQPVKQRKWNSLLPAYLSSMLTKMNWRTTSTYYWWYIRKPWSYLLDRYFLRSTSHLPTDAGPNEFM